LNFTFQEDEDFQVSLSENVEGRIELNQNPLCLYGLSKGCNTRITEYINLENSGNDKGGDKKAIFTCCQ